MAKLVNAYDSDSYEETPAGSSPVWRTTFGGLKMRKILILLVVVLLCSCKEKPISWQDVKEEYETIAVENSNFANDKNTFLKNDYLNIVNNINDYTDELTNNIDKENQELPINLYTEAIKLDSITKLIQNNTAELSLLKDLAKNAKDLVIYAYDKNEDFNNLKNTIKDLSDQINSIENDKWLALEIKQYLSWDNVEEEFDILINETIDNLTKRRKVTENELEELKNYIYNNYQKVIYGIDDSNLDIAKEIYASALKLERYTDDIEKEAPLKVNKFAIQTMEFIEKTLGKEIDDPEYDFLNEIENTKKWTLSLLNEVTTEMKRGCNET